MLPPNTPVLFDQCCTPRWGYNCLRTRSSGDKIVLLCVNQSETSITWRQFVIKPWEIIPRAPQKRVGSVRFWRRYTPKRWWVVIGCKILSCDWSVELTKILKTGAWATMTWMSHNKTLFFTLSLVGKVSDQIILTLITWINFDWPEPVFVVTKWVNVVRPLHATDTWIMISWLDRSQLWLVFQKNSEHYWSVYLQDWDHLVDCWDHHKDWSQEDRHTEEEDPPAESVIHDEETNQRVRHDPDHRDQTRPCEHRRVIS